MVGGLLAVVLGILSLCLGWLLISARKRLQRYAGITNVQAEVDLLTTQKKSIEKSNRDVSAELETLKRHLIYVKDEEDLQQCGFYTPRYEFASSKEYADKLDEIRTRQKELIKNESAIVCSTQWTVSGSKAEGRKMINRLVKLGLAAFNVQADNIILTAKYGNIERCEDKLRKIRENVDKLLEVNQCAVTPDFFELKIRELYLAFEYQEKLFQEKEEQRQIRLQMQEEERVRKEIEKAKIEAEKQESMYQVALEKAKKELEKKQSGENQELASKIFDLERLLAEAREKKERAISQAELTKQGHVYVVSNVGSFGEKVFKIGMTRRLDPFERVQELGDASVPFPFDVHAMIFSKDAPALESRLHEIFGGMRLNKVNLRKEFFQVSIDQIQAACDEIGHTVKFTMIAEAKEYKMSIAAESGDTQPQRVAA